MGRDIIFFINYGVLRTKKYLVEFTNIEKKLVVAREEGVWGRNELGVCGYQMQSIVCRMNKQHSPTLWLRCVLSLQSCPALCDAMNCNLPDSSVHEILQARILEWVAMPSPRNLSDPRTKPACLMSASLSGVFFTTSATQEANSSGNYIQYSVINHSEKEYEKNVCVCVCVCVYIYICITE